MTKIPRPQPAPAILLEKGAAQTANDCTEHEAGVLDFSADHTIYGDATVKAALRLMQRRKCAYCEAAVHDNPGTIDHFRPAAAVKQAHGEKAKKPGYFWLAYQWENLLLACIDCNQYSKHILFPLADPAQRAESFHDSLAREEPLLIDPSTEDPAEFLRFREEMLEAIDGNARGQRTMEVLRLNDERRELIGHRRLRLQNFRALCDFVRLHPNSPQAERAGQLIAHATGPEGEYRAMMAVAKGA